MYCNKCGQELAEDAVVCSACGADLLNPEKPENVLTAIIGALIGAVLGGASIVLLNQLGYVASISGLILAVCTLKGYELLGGKLNTRGILICCLLMAITPYFADRLSWAIVIQQEFADMGVTLGDAFAKVHEIIELAEVQGDYFKSLGMVYLFTVIGAFGTLKGLLQKKG